MSDRMEGSTAGRQSTTEGTKEEMKNMKKFGLAAIVASGLAAGHPWRRVSDAGNRIRRSTARVELPGYSTGVDHDQWINSVSRPSTSPQVDNTVQQSR